MIDYIDIEKLGFRRVVEVDEAYQNRYGRVSWYMEFLAVVKFDGGKNHITLNWDCDTRSVSVYKNDTNFVCSFSDWKLFRDYFELFMLKEE